MCDLTEGLALTQPTISHHLKRMADIGLVTPHKRSIWVYYQLVNGALDDLAGLLGQTHQSRTDRRPQHGHIR